MDDRLDRILAFLSVSGGAALLCKRTRRVLARAGDVDDATALAALDMELQPADGVVSTGGGLVAEVGLNHRLYARVPARSLDPQFGQRVRRARDIIERFALHTRRPPPTAPPAPASAHAVVFPKRRDRS